MTYTREEFSAKTKVQAYERSGGNCEGCGLPLTVGKFNYDHEIPDALGGEPTLDNCKVLCIGCHAEKTGKQDVPAISRAKRIRAKHIGAARKSRNPIPGSRASGWKRKMDGTVERR